MPDLMKQYFGAGTGPHYHGTPAELEPGDLIEPGKYPKSHPRSRCPGRAGGPAARAYLLRPRRATSPSITGRTSRGRARGRVHARSRVRLFRRQPPHVPLEARAPGQRRVTRVGPAARGPADALRRAGSTGTARASSPGTWWTPTTRTSRIRRPTTAFFTPDRGRAHHYAETARPASRTRREGTSRVYQVEPTAPHFSVETSAAGRRQATARASTAACTPRGRAAGGALLVVLASRWPTPPRHRQFGRQPRSGVTPGSTGPGAPTRTPTSSTRRAPTSPGLMKSRRRTVARPHSGGRSRTSCGRDFTPLHAGRPPLRPA